jgi:hypothetical protein
MLEFSSITASSYDAESLAPELTEKSAEGWAVVSIVAAGTNIVAYLSREGADSVSGGGESADVSVDASPVAAAAIAAVVAADAAADEAVAASEVTDAGSDPADSAAAGTEATDAYAAAVVDTPSLPGDDTPYVPADSSISTEPAATPAVDADDAANAAATAAATAADEPAGWAAAPDNDIADLAAQVGADDAVEAAAGGTAPESSVPAGWYADPSGRYELRYWDGNAWTEHVSRAGQQFTDPPVA